MATCRFIVNTALRKLGVAGGGRDARPSDAADTLAALQGLYASWITAGAFGRLYDVTADGDHYARPGQHVLRMSGSVFLPGHECAWRYRDGYLEEVTDNDGEAILDDAGNPILSEQEVTWRPPPAPPPHDCAVVVVTDEEGGKTVQFIFDGAVKQWREPHLLTLDEEAPLSARDPQGLAAELAVTVSDQFGSDVQAATIRAARAYRTALTHRYNSPRREAVACYF